MALNYRYDKKGKVIGIGWGKGKNYEAGQKKLRKNNTKKKSSLKIAGAGDTPGAAAAKAMAKKRIANKQTIAQAEAKRDKSMKKGLKERHAAWKKARKEGTLGDWEKKYHPDRTPEYKNKKKKKKKVDHTGKPGGKYQFTTM